MPALMRPFRAPRGWEQLYTLAPIRNGRLMGRAIVTTPEWLNTPLCDCEEKMITSASSKRSVVKAITYRIIIVFLDFVVIYLLTGQLRMALGFMIVSNVYTTL